MPARTRPVPAFAAIGNELADPGPVPLRQGGRRVPLTDLDAARGVASCPGPDVSLARQLARLADAQLRPAKLRSASSWAKQQGPSLTTGQAGAHRGQRPAGASLARAAAANAALVRGC
jgi:hypothetical protein